MKRKRNNRYPSNEFAKRQQNDEESGKGAEEEVKHRPTAVNRQQFNAEQSTLKLCDLGGCEAQFLVS